MTDKIRILVADDHALVRMGLVSLLNGKSDMEVVGEADNGEAAVSKALKLHPDVIIMDLVMPRKNGIEAASELRAKLPEARILLLTSFGSSAEIGRALEAGAAGALLKSIPNAELVAAIRKIANGKRVVSPDIEQMMTDNPPVPSLSPRQKDMLESIIRGLTNSQIALQLEISPESVKTHIAKLFEKIGAANRAEAVAIALQKHLLKM